MTSIDEQVRRTAKDKKRPLLNAEQPRRVLTDLMNQRHPLYEEIADYAIDTDGRSPQFVAQQLIGHIIGVKLARPVYLLRSIVFKCPILNTFQS